jgi:aspartyl-tRNA(Asn)/glutamyl-tRNA(Gln) amidotransferase subunit A
LATGTDGGGSIRIPAGFCGIVGLKPTYGRVPLYPSSPFGTLAHAGPMTRTVDDAALMLDVLSGPDARDWSALPPPIGSFRDHLDDGVGGLRVAFSPALGYVDVDNEVATAVRAAVDVLAGLGARVTEVDPGFADPVRAYHVLWFSGRRRRWSICRRTPREGWNRACRRWWPRVGRSARWTTWRPRRSGWLWGARWVDFTSDSICS